METVLTASQLLHVWEQARSQTPVQRALTLLALAVPAEPPDALVRYRIGRRDRELLALRERLFGSRLTGMASCPSCGQPVEVDFAVADIRTDQSQDHEEIHLLQVEEYEVSFRLPVCDDLDSIDPRAGESEKKSALIRRCVAGARRGTDVLSDPLPESVVQAVSQRMSELDPEGDIQLTLTCPKCGDGWLAPLDIVSYLWNEIHAWAGRTLRDVHALASAYGWREAEILSLTPSRRQAYLEMIQS